VFCVRSLSLKSTHKYAIIPTLSAQGWSYICIMIRSYFLPILVALLLVVSACRSEIVATTPTTVPNPVATVAAESPTVTADNSTVTVPAPGGDSGVVNGTILRTGSQQPYPEGLDLYLAEILSGQVETASLDKTSAPYADPDSNGKFVFSNVKPGRYALVARTPLTEVLVPDPQNTQNVVMVNVEPGKVVDLGQLLLDLDL
jgi:hypothetical protein